MAVHSFLSRGSGHRGGSLLSDLSKWHKTAPGNVHTRCKEKCLHSEGSHTLEHASYGGS